MNQKEPLLRFFINVFTQLGIWFVAIILTLSLIYGQFPPPFAKIRQSISQLQGVMNNSDPNLQMIKNNQRRLEETLKMADHADQPVEASGEVAESASQRERQIFESQIQILRFKVQTLESRQEAMASEIAKLRSDLKVPSNTINR